MSGNEGDSKSNFSLDELAAIEDQTPIRSVFAEAIDHDGRLYTLYLIEKHPDGPYIRIDTVNRRDFLSDMDEVEQEALINFAQRVRTKTGGYFNIHPFYGAVWGTKLTPVAPGFLTDLKGSDENLSMIIYLTSNGLTFDEGVSDDHSKIPLTFRLGSEHAKRFLRYLQGASVNNPNQRDRDQAVANGLGEAWDSQFHQFNSSETPTLLRLTPPEIATMLKSLSELGIDVIRIKKLFFDI